MKKKLASLLISLLMVLGACSISSACLFVWYQPELPERK
ncbi:MAG TPA: cyclic lactone autoinducer peptide [Bacillota bacterium]|nr:cyclic lactone autoinducer peptide [Bacillota bacterium]